MVRHGMYSNCPDTVKGTELAKGVYIECFLLRTSLRMLNMSM